MEEKFHLKNHKIYWRKLSELKSVEINAKKVIFGGIVLPHDDVCECVCAKTRYIKAIGVEKIGLHFVASPQILFSHFTMCSEIGVIGKASTSD